MSRAVCYRTRCLVKSIPLVATAVIVGWQLLWLGWPSPRDTYNGTSLDITSGTNPHPFFYILEAAHVCRDAHVFLLIYVHSAPQNHRRRNSIRSTWGRRDVDPNIRLVFLLGRASDSLQQSALQLESDLYGDLVQEDFVDAYRNLTYKAVLGLRWTAQHCPHARYVLKTDDDVFVNTFHVLTKLRQIDSAGSPRRARIFCLLWTRMAVIRNPRSKWYVAPAEFASKMFPPYCSGLAFVYSSGDLAARMFRISLKTPFFWIDDFYVTGLLAHSAGVTRVRWNEFYEVSATRFPNTFANPAELEKRLFGHVHNLDQLQNTWNQLHKQQQQQINNLTYPFS